jgi:propionyl-CoA carboxylase alpha chain/3-methylcrotonyl-CoA carboxylase alpha subunit/acetyl-CoA/propionyl-CoA carboxylase biotin carboxyl carrier protein
MPLTKPPFAKMLIANRGEIACRVIRTLREMGIVSVAIHHPSEIGAPHVAMADEALAISGATPVAAHLDGAAIIDAARRSGAEAIHPGYGFLSENAGFAKAVAQAGLVFVGPDAETIHLMGDKLRARAFAKAQGVPVSPSAIMMDDVATFLAEAEAIGFPLLVKAAAGGGGKGMSIVRSADELAARSSAASTEAARYFSDGRVYAERYVERPRHIEVQVLGDGAGGVLHLFERECSVQRRFQKIIEEAPAPDLPPSLRNAMREAAVRLAQSARYRNAGTVEFILAPDGQFFFLEMNTRLQVEHAVTEMITGLDLVRCQIDIAAGKPLPLQQNDVKASGCAIECRICAEDPERDFLPETGRILGLETPAGPTLRFDSGVRIGQSVTADFDSLMAKLVVHGADRAQAIERMTAALSHLAILGVTTNVDYLARLMKLEAFANGDLHTGFVLEHAGELARPEACEPDSDLALIVAALGDPDFRRLVFDVPEPYATMGGWRN